MHLLFFAALAVALSAGVVAGAVYLTWRWSGPGARACASILLFVFVALLAGVPGMHMCDEGRTPLFVMLAGGSLAAAMPFLFKDQRWRMATSAWAIAATTMLVAAWLTDIYHHDRYTGNPANSSGRFWHTPFTGLYPRHPAAWGER